MSLYKNRDCFFIYSSFLAGKEAKEAGGTYEWFPLDPLSTFDGDAVPLDSPCSMGGAERFSSSRSGKSTARTKSKRRQRTERLSGVESWPETETLDGIGSGHSPPTAALLGWSCAKKSLHFSSNFWCFDKLQKVRGRGCVSLQAFGTRIGCRRY